MSKSQQILSNQNEPQVVLFVLLYYLYIIILYIIIICIILLHISLQEKLG